VFPTPDGKGRFTPLTPIAPDLPAGHFTVATRRGKQFNSMVHERRDALTGALRDAVLVAADDALRLGLRDGDRVALRSDHGSLEGEVLIAAVKPGNVQVHWPEGNTLLAAGRRSPEAGIPDYNTWVELELVSPARQSARGLQGPGR
jgi:anaerobic selenocysteine-containing dehydrogenase